MRLIIIRHGESEANRLGIHAGQKDFDLSENGRVQARLVADRLKGKDIEIIYSSDLKRASNTAKIIAKDHCLKVVIDKRLREFDCGKKMASFSKDKRWSWWGSYRDGEARRLGVSSGDIESPGRESENMLKFRIKSFWDEIKNRHNGIVIIVAHGGVNRALFCLLGHCGLEDSFKIRQKNTCVNEFEISDGKCAFNKINCLEHLS